MSEQLDLLSASSRTSKDTSTEDLNQSSKTWKEQVTIQRGEYSQRKKLAHLTKGNASSSWATPNTMDSLPQRSEEALKRQATTTRDGRAKPANLREQVNERSMEIYAEKKYPLLFPTPTATPYGNNQGGAAGRKGQVRHSLESMAKHDLWPTPTAMTGGTGVAPSHEKGGHGWNTGAAVKDSLSDNPKRQWPTPTATERSGTNPKTGKGHGLSKAVKNWPTPSTRDHKGGYKGGRIRNGKVSMDTLDVAVQHTDNKDQTSGTLNPNWVEWLMGLPTEWTDLDSWVTELSPKQPPEHGRS